MGKYEQPLGWFADTTDEDDPDHSEEFPWRPFLQLPGMVASLSISFATEEACKDFIQKDVIGKGFFPGDDPSGEAGTNAVAGS